LNDRNGVIVSSKNVGAMAELGDFCVIAAEITSTGIATALLEARNLSTESRRKMSFELKRQIQEFDLGSGLNQLLPISKFLKRFKS
jgi:trehalose-6-phosphate synthase